MLLDHFMNAIVSSGTVRVIDTRGRISTYGNGQAPRCTMRLHRRGVGFRIASNPALRFAEAYMEGDVSFEEGTLDDFLMITLREDPSLFRHWAIRLIASIARQGRHLKQYNPIGKARRNVAHHYDLSGALYDLFLDRDRQYSCAYFRSPHDDLERAQRDKKQHIAGKLLLDRPGLRVLDIGSGWGGLGLYLAEHSGCNVTGVTLSVEQHKSSQERARQARLDQRVSFKLRDYREEEGTYDRIVSVGMFEHVGKRNYDEFFQKVHDLLSDDGVCLLHTIGRFTMPGPINPFIRKYIFPGADLATLSEVLPSIERAGLLTTDIEILRLHYAETLRLWHQRFQANREKIAELYDERFCRMWELYLKGCEYGFRTQDLTVFQIQLAKSQDAVPLTRDYMYDWGRAGRQERAHAAE